MSTVVTVDAPESTPALSALLCLTIAVLGDDPDVLEAAFENAGDIAHHMSTMDLSVIRLRARSEDAKVKRDFAQAAVWLRAFKSRKAALGGL